ncbi:MAG: HK97 family phage prohead protease [Cetobacterium sp.]
MNKNKLKDDLFITRSFNLLDLRAIDNENNKATIEGHPVVFEQTTDIGGYFYERIEREAFVDCDLTDVLFFVNHNMNKIPLARSRRNNGNSTMQLQVDDKGLFIKADLDVENNQDARSLYSAIKRGDIDGMSFAFRIKEQKWENLDTDMPTRVITKFAKVFEVSAVNTPAYAQTDINARDKSALDNAKSTLDNVRYKGSELDNSGELEKEKIKLLRLKLGGK